MNDIKWSPFSMQEIGGPNPLFTGDWGIKYGNFVLHPNEGWVALAACSVVAVRYRSGPIIEIGSNFGNVIGKGGVDYFLKRKSVSVLGEVAKYYKVPFYTCDIRRTAHVNYDKHTHFGGDSLDFIKQLPADIKPSVVFIDGCHMSHHVRKEVDFFLEKLIPGGLIMLHDTLPPNEGYLDEGACGDSYLVRQYLEKNREELNIDVLTWPYTAANCGLTMVLKKEKTDLYFRK